MQSINHEIERINLALGDERTNPRYAELYAAQQALAWATNPEGFKAPFDLVMGTQANPMLRKALAYRIVQAMTLAWKRGKIGSEGIKKGLSEAINSLVSKHFANSEVVRAFARVEIDADDCEYLSVTVVLDDKFHFDARKAMDFLNDLGQELASAGEDMRSPVIDFVKESESEELEEAA